MVGLGILIAVPLGAVTAASPVLAVSGLGIFGSALAVFGIGIRRALLGCLILTLTAVRFAAIPEIDFGLLRYVAVITLLAVTWHQGQATRRSFRELTSATRWLLRGLWLLFALAVASNAWSISAADTIPQTIAFGCLVLLIHLNVTRFWHTANQIANDMAIIFWVLVTTVVIGLVVNPGTVGRISGLYKNPNGLAMTCAIGSVVGIGLCLHRRATGSAYKILLAPLAVLVCTLVLTQSRTSIIAVIAAILFLLVRMGMSTILIIFAGTAFAGAGLIIFAPSLTSLPRPLAELALRFTDPGEAGLLSNRTLIWDYAYDLWHRQPVTGYGFRSGEIIFDIDRGLTTVDNSVAHSSYIQMLVELGLIGLIPSAILVATCLLILRRCPVRGLGAGMTASVVVGLGVGGGESAVFGVGQSFSWSLWLAIAAAACLSDQHRLSVSPPASGSRSVDVPALVPMGGSTSAVLDKAVGRRPASVGNGEPYPGTAPDEPARQQESRP